jgi:hypothetical protein
MALRSSSTDISYTQVQAEETREAENEIDLEGRKIFEIEFSSALDRDNL